MGGWLGLPAMRISLRGSELHAAARRAVGLTAIEDSSSRRKVERSMGKTFAGTIEAESVKRQGRAMVIDQEAIGQFSRGSF
jgi:hypothetical protein